MGRLTEKEAIEGFKIDNALLGENESGTVERNNIAIKCIEELQEYRSICDSPEKLKIIDELYLERCEEINRLKAEFAEIRNKTIEEFRSEAINFEDYIEPINESPCGAILMYSGYDITKMIMKISEKLKEVQDVN